MIVNVDIHEKSFGPKILYNDLKLSLQAKEKVGVIGRNGTGKSTLFHILSGNDKDFSGEIKFRKNLVVIASRQEHQAYKDTPVLAYILDDLPKYATIKHIIDTYPDTMGESIRKINEFSEALEQFNALGYFEVESEIINSLQTYQLDEAQIKGTIGKLSGGQKRFVELVKVQHAKAELVLIDEPTNHMDYVAKNLFIDWLRMEQASTLVITHDRDVLREVDRIIEIRDGQALSFNGNYDAYLRTNASKIVSEVNEYEVTQSRIVNLKNDVVRFQRLKERARDPDTIKRFKGQEQRAKDALKELQKLEKPSFWIDQDSLEGMNDKITGSYDKHKAKNIRVSMKKQSSASSRLLIESHELSLGYDNPLFEGVSFQLREGERIRLHGRNGAGKTTLINAILSQAFGTNLAPASLLSDGVRDTAGLLPISGFPSPVLRSPYLSTASSVLPGRTETELSARSVKETEIQKFSGSVLVEKELKIGVYNQEISADVLGLTLFDAVEKVLLQKGVNASDQRIRQLLSDYLFHPQGDGALTLDQLSGGQKARYQLICMLANDPQVLILDEPTNHLDLPSIEELEGALSTYGGAIIYVSHDSYFSSKIQAKQIKIG